MQEPFVIQVNREMQPILFVHNQAQSFVIIDLKLLQERWPVRERYEQNRLVNPFSVMWAVLHSSMVFCWFASWHSLFPVFFAWLFNKPSLVVVGGYDTANLPEANYGSQRGGLRRWVSRAIIKMATHLLVNSDSARREAIANAGADPDKITLVYHGIEPLAMGSLESREQLALTIGQVWRENLLRKGLLPFVEAAKYLPETQFVHVGKWRDDSIDDLRVAAGANVQFAGFVAADELEALCQRAKVYVQVSLHEGFGMSLAEAMSAGCIPVVTSVGSLPEVVGDTGVYARSNTPEDVAAAIRQALEWDDTQRQRARNRILTEFPIERRRQTLHGLIEKLFAPRSLRGN